MTSGKEAACQCGRHWRWTHRRCGFNCWLGKIPRRRIPTPIESERHFKSVWIYACLSVCLWFWIILLRFICKWALTQLALKERKHLGFPGGSMVKKPPASAKDRFYPWFRETPRAAEQLSPIHHHHWSPRALELMIHKRSSYNEKLIHHN